MSPSSPINVWLVLGALNGGVSRSAYALSLIEANALQAVFNGDDPSMDVFILQLAGDKHGGQNKQ